MWSQRLSEAEKLSQRPPPEKVEKMTREEVNAVQTNLSKANSLYMGLCTDPALTTTQKVAVVKSYLIHHPEEGKDMVARYRDGLRFHRGKAYTDLALVIRQLSNLKEMDDHERMVCVMCLYNNGILEMCYSGFVDLAEDVDVNVKYRVDACRYLFGNGEPHYKELAQENLHEITNSLAYPSEFRYEVIASFITRNGIHSLMNSGTIKVPYDEEFVHGLQTLFFNNEENGIRERILSAQSLLAMECTEEEDKQSIMKKLLSIAQSTSHTENTRADAADVLLRLSTSKEYADEARAVIAELGASALATGSTLLSRIRTIYRDSQNVHNETIAASVNTFLEKVLNDPSHVMGTIPTFIDVYNAVSALVRTRLSSPKEKFSAMRSLNRIAIDTAVFTKHRVTNSDIFVHVWMCILVRPPQDQEELIKRLLQELIESDDTCSTGHAERYVNVLSSYDVDLRISWSDQIKANIVGRLEARIRNHPNNDEKQAIALGALVDADKEDRELYLKFINTTLEALYTELLGEFVGEGYITKEEFDRWFADGKNVIMRSTTPSS